MDTTKVYKVYGVLATKPTLFSPCMFMTVDSPGWIVSNRSSIELEYNEHNDKYIKKGIHVFVEKEKATNFMNYIRDPRMIFCPTYAVVELEAYYTDLVISDGIETIYTKVFISNEEFDKTIAKAVANNQIMGKDRNVEKQEEQYYYIISALEPKVEK